MRKAWLAALILLVASLAGCLGANDAPDDEEVDAQQRAEVTESTGGIQGTITNPAIEALPDVTITLTDTGDTSESAEDGSFAFSELAPDTYTLTFEADGFLGSERDVDVYAGEVTFVDMVLTKQPDLTPYMQQYERTGFMECSWGAATGTHIVSWSMCGELGEATNAQTTFTQEIEPDPWQIITEVDWEPTSPLADRFWMNSETTGFNNAWNVAFANIQSTPPIVDNTDREQIANIVGNFSAICNGEMDPSLYSNNVNDPEAYCGHNIIEDGANVDVGVSVQTSDQATIQTPPDQLGHVGAGFAPQQEFTVYQTIFYHAPACEDYSVVTDNECAQTQQAPSEDPYDEIEA